MSRGNPRERNMGRFVISNAKNGLSGCSPYINVGADPKIFSKDFLSVNISRDVRDLPHVEIFSQHPLESLSSLSVMER